MKKRTLPNQVFICPPWQVFVWLWIKKHDITYMNESILFSIKKSCTQSHKNGSRPINVGQLPFKV
jgi:hypothetical protein